MSKSTVKVNFGFLESIVLKGISAYVVDVEIIRDEQVPYLLVHVEGPDVPDVQRCRAIVTQTTKLEPC